MSSIFAIFIDFGYCLDIYGVGIGNSIENTQISTIRPDLHSNFPSKEIYFFKYCGARYYLQ